MFLRVYYRACHKKDLESRDFSSHFCIIIITDVDTFRLHLFSSFSPYLSPSVFSPFYPQTFFCTKLSCLANCFGCKTFLRATDNAKDTRIEEIGQCWNIQYSETTVRKSSWSSFFYHLCVILVVLIFISFFYATFIKLPFLIKKIYIA